ncbi:MAG: hypothetical protein ACK55X_01805 [Synechococcaceae cyanobacterium]|jgi:hypothetical protein
MARFPWPAAPFAPAGRADAPALQATVWVLNTLEPVAERLCALLPEAPGDWSRAEAILAREGRLAVFAGAPAEGRILEAALRAQGLTTSLNLRPALRE